MLDFRIADAANDTRFQPSRHRTLPIPESVTPVAGYPQKLRIYLTNASPFWQVKCFFRGKSYTKSLRTTHRAVAIRAAKEFFHIKTAEIFGTEIVERPNTEPLFNDLVAPMLAIEQARTQRGEFSTDGLRILQNRLSKTIVPFFADMPIKRIGYQQVSDFMNSLSQAGHTSTTIQQHLVATRKVLRHAYAMGLISAVPVFPNVRISNSPRGSFSVSEYLKLVRTARRRKGQEIPILTTAHSRRGVNRIERYARVSNDLHWLIVFMVNSFVRPSDIKNLQHQHITVVRGEHVYLRLNLPESKKHDKPIVTLQPAVRVYERLLEAQMAAGYGAPTDYLFLPDVPDRKKAIEFLGYQFKFIQAAAGIEANAANGKERTLYSLRHTAITFRLLYGGAIDLLTLARNARTSVNMIEKFYSSNLNAEMNIDLLQGKRK